MDDKPVPAVGSIAKQRMKKAPKLTVFMPDTVKDVVYTCMGPDQEPGAPNTRVWLGAPPAGNHGWCVTPEQAEEIAADLLLAARQVREGCK